MEIFQIFKSLCWDAHMLLILISNMETTPVISLKVQFLHLSNNLMPKFFSDTELNQFRSMLLSRCRPNCLGILKKNNIYFWNCTVIVIIHFSTSIRMIWIVTFLWALLCVYLMVKTIFDYQLSSWFCWAMWWK